MALSRRAFSALFFGGALVGGTPFQLALAEPIPVDRVAVRFSAPELGGVRSPRFVFQRVLSFEARLSALTSGERGAAFRERHVSDALERHVAETLLASLRVDPEPSAEEISRQAASARRILEERVGGADSFKAAAAAEGISDRELLALFRRQARAGLYLDRMVTPMLEPSAAELRALHRSGHTPFTSAPFESVLPGLKRWYVSSRLNEALASYFQNARSRLEIVLVDLPKAPE